MQHPLTVYRKRLGDAQDRRRSSFAKNHNLHKTADQSQGFPFEQNDKRSNERFNERFSLALLPQPLCFLFSHLLPFNLLLLLEFLLCRSVIRDRPRASSGIAAQIAIG